MAQIAAKKFINFIESGATKPFVVENDNGQKWVVKALGNPFGTQAVFNEYVVGALARFIDLPWPKTSLIDLSKEIIKTLGDNNLSVTSSIAVGAEYIYGLKPVEFPNHLSLFGENSNKENVKYLSSIFTDPTMLDSFYGKSVFDNWILLKDTKPDTLHLQPNGQPIFLDATFAFNYTDKDQEWDKGRLHWDFAALNHELSPYLRGMVANITKYDVWIERIKDIPEAKIGALLNMVPKGWKVPTDYMFELKKFLNSTKKVFLPMFSEYLEILRSPI
jgi:hypothetical protein